MLCALVPLRPFSLYAPASAPAWRGEQPVTACHQPRRLLNRVRSHALQSAAPQPHRAIHPPLPFPNAPNRPQFVSSESTATSFRTLRDGKLYSSWLQGVEARGPPPLLCRAR